VDLSVTVTGIRLKNPVLAASGTVGYGVEFAELVDLNQLGGVVVKGLSAQPLAGLPAPRLCETPAGMLNAVGLQNIGVRRFIAEKLPALRQYDTAIIANVFGGTTEEYVEVIEELNGAEGVAAYELNVSSPNARRGGMHFGADPELLREVVSAAKQACLGRQAARRPLWVKLTPNVGDIRQFARIAEQAGADALSLINTLKAMAVDLATRRSKLGHLTGGLSGPAIKPVALRMVWEAAQAVSIPVVGVGGITRGTDALEFLVVGAQAVQVGTANFVEPSAAARIIAEIRNYCEINGIKSLQGIIGTLQTS